FLQLPFRYHPGRRDKHSVRQLAALQRFRFERRHEPRVDLGLTANELWARVETIPKEFYPNQLWRPTPDQSDDRDGRFELLRYSECARRQDLPGEIIRPPGW